MSNFEKIYHIDPSREHSPSIEMSDKKFIELQNKKLNPVGFAYRPPVEEESMSPTLKEKFNKARKLTKDTKVIKLEDPNAKSKSKSPKRKAKRVPAKVHTTTVESVQEELS